MFNFILIILNVFLIVDTEKYKKPVFYWTLAYERLIGLRHTQYVYQEIQQYLFDICALKKKIKKKSHVYNLTSDY